MNSCFDEVASYIVYGTTCYFILSKMIFCATKYFSEKVLFDELNIASIILPCLQYISTLLYQTKILKPQPTITIYVFGMYMHRY